MEIREYLDTLSGQIRNRKARAMAAKEIEDHINDQADFFEGQGMDHQEAVQEAVRQMGDPVEAGVELDRIHRPQMEWRLFGWIVLFSILGLAIQYVCFYCCRTWEVSAQSKWILGDSTGNFVRQCAYTVIGMAVMAVICLLDYSVIGKHARLLAACFLAIIVLSCTFGVVRQINGGHPQLKCLLYLFVPLYGGILYRNRGKGCGGIGLCYLWIGAAFLVGARSIGGGLGVIMDVIAVCLVMLLAAVCKGWFHLSKKSGIKTAAVLLALMAVSAGLFVKFGLSPYQAMRLKVWLHPEQYADLGGYSIVTIRKIVSSLSINRDCFRILEERGLEDFLYAWESGGDFMILHTAVAMGLFKTLCILCLFGAFFIYLFWLAAREKNQMGQIMGLGCTLMLAVETVRNVMYNFGIGLSATGGIPFFSYGRVHTLAVYVLLGILLSICRYRNLVWEDPVKSGDGSAVKIGNYVIRVEKRPVS